MAPISAHVFIQQSGTHMKSLLFDGVGTEPYLAEVAVADPRAGEVLVRMTTAGVCHSDLHVINGDWPFDHRVALGHEGAGIVEALGEGISDLAVGDQVVLSWFAPCNTCASCIAGQSWLCQASGAATNGLPDGSTPLTAADGNEVRPYLGVGTFSDYAVVPRSAVVPIPAEVPAAVAALIGCSVTTGVGAVMNTADVRAGQSAVVVGCGGVGQTIIMGLKLVGASTIIAIDLSPDRLETATEFGATHTLRGDDPELAEKIVAISNGGVDYAFDAIGLAATSARLPDYLKPGGAAVLVGMPARDVEVGFKTWHLVATGKRILGCNYGSSRPQVDFPRIARLYLGGQLPLDKLIGDTIPVADAARAIDDLRASTGRRMVVDHSL
ncbi:alcohol dehydrogenase [Salinibacterium amurskyense]|nr:alcohol dehydrogenase [Salinibacterium amurskyense]